MATGARKAFIPVGIRLLPVVLLLATTFNPASAQQRVPNTAVTGISASSPAAVCATYDSLNPTVVYYGTCTSSVNTTMTNFISLAYTDIFAVKNAATLTSTQASYFTNTNERSFMTLTSGQVGGAFATLTTGGSTYYRLDAKADFTGTTPSGTQYLTLSQANYMLPYTQNAITTAVNDFYADSGTGSSMGNSFQACITPPVAGACTTQRTFAPGSIKYSLFGRFSGAFWKTTKDTHKAFVMRQTITMTGYKAYFNNDASLTLSTIGGADVSSITFVSDLGSAGASMTFTFPATVLYGSNMVTTGSGATTTVNIPAPPGQLIPSSSGNVQIKVSSAGDNKLNIDYLFASADQVSMTSDSSCTGYFIYDPTVTYTADPKTASSSSSLSSGAIAGIVVGSVAFAVLVAGAILFVVHRKKQSSTSPASKSNGGMDMTHF